MPRKAMSYKRKARGRSGQVAVENAVRRVMAGSGTKSLRRTSFAISALPKMMSTSGAFILSHRECVGALTSDALTTYKPVKIGNPVAPWPQTGLPIYPTSSDLFPWLSTIAARFEQYKWRKCNIQFITASGDGTTANLAQGNVMAYIEYNPTTLIPPGSSQAFLNNFGAVATKPSQSFQMGVQAQGNPFELKWTASGGDARFSADGSLYMATEGVPAGAVFGYLYVDYTIELHKPQMSPAELQEQGFNMNMSFWPSTLSTESTTFTTYQDAAVTNVPLSSYDAVGNASFAGTPFLKEVLLTQQSVGTNSVILTFPAGIFGAQGIVVDAEHVLQMRIGIRSVHTGDYVPALVSVNTDSPNVTYQNTFAGVFANVNGSNGSWRRGLVGGFFPVASLPEFRGSLTSFSIDISVNTDAGFWLLLACGQNTNNTLVVGNPGSADPLNERVIHCTRLFED